MFAAFNFVCLIAGKESSSTFLSRCGVKCRRRAGSDFPLRKESNKPSYMSSGGTSWSNREINKSLVCFILFIFFNHMAKIVVHRGEQRRKLTKKKKKKCWKNNHSLTFICKTECWIILKISLCDWGWSVPLACWGVNLIRVSTSARSRWGCWVVQVGLHS